MTINELIAKLSFLQFVELFGTMWIKEQSKFMKWALWEGVERDGKKYMGQPEMLEAFARNKITWLAKARQLGGSEGAALYAIYLCLKYPKTQVLVLSKDNPGSEIFLAKRVKSKLDGMLLMLDPAGNLWPFAGIGGVLPWRTKTDGNCVIDGRISFYNESEIIALSSDSSGGRGYTPRLVIFDEAATYSLRDAENLWSSILGSLNEDAQIIVISTGVAGSWYNIMTKQMMGAGVPGAELVFLPDDIRPGHDIAWREARLKAFGNNVVKMRREHPLVIEDLFSTNEGLVIGSWDEGVHVGSLHSGPEDLGWKEGDEFYLIYDHGKTRAHPAVCWFVRYNRYDDFAYVFDEVFERGKELTYVGPKIREKHLMYTLGGAPVSMNVADGAIFNDLGMKTVAMVLSEETGLTWTKAFKHDKKQSLEWLQQRFFRNGIKLHPCLRGTAEDGGSIVQLEKWSYKEGKDTPVEIEDDAGDVGRYLCAQVEKGVKPPEKGMLEKNMDYIRRLEQRALEDEYGEPLPINLSTIGAGDLERSALV